MDALRSFGYGISLGPFPVVVWFGLAALLLMVVTAAIAGLKKQVPAFRRVSVRAHRALAIGALVLALVHLALGLSVYVSAESRSPKTPGASSPAATTPPRALPEGARPGTAVDGVIRDGEYAHQTTVAGAAVYWSNDARTLRVGVVSPGTGYVAIALDPERRMKGANYILGAVVNGQVVARDDFGTGPLSHQPDTACGGAETILEKAGREADGKTYFEFVIPLDSSDPADKPLMPGKTYAALVAFHRSNDDFGVTHSDRGAFTMSLDPAP